MDFFGRFHLLMLHFPIGLLGFAVLLRIAAPRKNNADWQSAAALALAWGAAAACLSAISGWLLAEQGLYAPSALFWHRWLGTLTAAASLGAWRLRATHLGLPLLAATGALLVAAGHFGGTLTHGEGYLSAPFLEKETADEPLAVAPPKPETPVYQAFVQPILQKKCISCHGAAKQKGRLRLDSPEAIGAGGESGKPMLVAGKPDESELLRRAMLPMSDEKHMPPSGRPPLLPDELVLLRWWIADGGADFSLRFSEMKITPEVQGVFERAQNARTASPVFAKKINPAAPKMLAELRENGISAVPLGEASTWLSVSCAGQRDLTAQKITLLKNIREQTVYLDFGQTNLDGAGLKTLAAMPHLVRLNLAATKIADADLPALAGLEFLETLNLTATAVTDAGLASLAPLKNLRRLHLWKTATTDAGRQRLRAQLPDLQINIGAPIDTTAAAPQLRAPKILSARTVFSDTLQVTLDFPFTGIDLFYDLNEASPTTASPRYTGQPIVLDRTTRLRTFAARTGWANSPIAEATFVRKSLSPRSVALLHPPSPRYSANGAASLNDGIIGALSGDKAWLGFEGEHMTAVLDFGEITDFQRVNVHCLDDNSPWIFAPAGLKAWVSDDGKRWQPCLDKQFPKPMAMQPTRTLFLSESLGQPRRARFVKIMVQSLLKNPPFHPSPGSKCWIFVDEIFVE